MGHYLFSFSGRINRAKQWAFVLIAIALGIIQAAFVHLTIGIPAILDVLARKQPFAALTQGNTRFSVLALCAIVLLGLYMRLAVDTKRLHDRGKSAWWLLIFVFAPLVLNIPTLIEASMNFPHIADVIRAAQQHLPRPPHVPMTRSPLAILANGAATILSLWAFVELYCLRGTVGDNRYGPDPLAHKG